MSNYIKNGYVCKIDRDPHEPLEYMAQRGYFVVSQQPKTQKEYDECVAYSRIYINKVYNECGYQPEVEQRLERMINNMFEK